MYTNETRKTVTGNNTENSVTFGRVVFEIHEQKNRQIDRQTYRQTDKQTDRQTYTILCTLPEAK